MSVVALARPVLPARKHLDWISDDLTYYPHQIDGVREMAARGSMILGDEMGLGKSLQALTVFAVDCQIGWGQRLLIVCPATLKGNWYNEIMENTLFRNVTVFGQEIKPSTSPTDDDTWRNITPAKRLAQLESFRALGTDEPNILIVNYEQVDTYVEEFNSIGFDCVVYDEAHSMKNPKAKRTKACMLLKGKRHLELTGSPMLNHVNELWTLLHRIEPKRFDNYYAFQHRFCVFGGFKDKQIVGVKNEAELTRILNEYMIRRLKVDVLDLPEKQYVQVVVPLHPEQRRLYDKVKDELILPHADAAEGEDIANAMVMFLRLKQICGTTAAIEGYDDNSYKLDRVISDCVELIENGHKVVQFTQFRSVLAALAARLDALGIPHYDIHGDVPKTDRVPISKRWAADPRPGVLLAMHQVAGVGLTLTAARHTQMVDKLFVPKLNEQSEDRTHRIGTDVTQPVTYLEYICEGSIEYRVEKILKRKRRIFDDVVEDGNFHRKLYRAMMGESA